MGPADMYSRRNQRTPPNGRKAPRDYITHIRYLSSCNKRKTEPCVMQQTSFLCHCGKNFLLALAGEV